MMKLRKKSFPASIVSLLHNHGLRVLAEPTARGASRKHAASSITPPDENALLTGTPFIKLPLVCSQAARKYKRDINTGETIQRGAHGETCPSPSFFTSHDQKKKKKFKKAMTVMYLEYSLISKKLMFLECWRETRLEITCRSLVRRE
jgi:hypothetical protein